MENHQLEIGTNAMGNGKFFLMMSIFFLVMFSIMFINIVDIDHFYISLTMIYMTLLMISPMAGDFGRWGTSSFRNHRQTISLRTDQV